MGIGGVSSSSGIFHLNEVGFDESRRNYSSVQQQTTPSGDRVDISEEAKKLYSEMIHKYDKGGTAGKNSAESQPLADTAYNAGGKEATKSPDKAQAASGGASAAGGPSSESNADEIEDIKKKIESLKSQLMSLASQTQDDGGNGAAQQKMNALQAQIASLQAQLNAMQAGA